MTQQQAPLLHLFTFSAGDENYQNKVKTESSTLSKTDISDLKMESWVRLYSMKQ